MLVSIAVEQAKVIGMLIGAADFALCIPGIACLEAQPVAEIAADADIPDIGIGILVEAAGIVLRETGAVRDTVKAERCIEAAGWCIVQAEALKGGSCIIGQAIGQLAAAGCKTQHAAPAAVRADAVASCGKGSCEFFVSDRYARTGNHVIENQSLIGIEREFSKIIGHCPITASDPGTIYNELQIGGGAEVHRPVCDEVNMRGGTPMVIDGDGRVEAEEQLVGAAAVVIAVLIHDTISRIFDFSAEGDVVGSFFEAADAQAKSFELVGKLCLKLCEPGRICCVCLVRRGHGPGDKLSHFIAGQGLAFLQALDERTRHELVFCQRRQCIIGPVVSRKLRKWIFFCRGRRCRKQEKGEQRSGWQAFFHH